MKYRPCEANPPRPDRENESEEARPPKLLVTPQTIGANSNVKGSGGLTMTVYVGRPHYRYISCISMYTSFQANRHLTHEAPPRHWRSA